MLPHTPTPRRDGTNQHKTNQRTNHLSEESEVSLSRLPAPLDTAPQNLPNWLRVIAMEMGLSRTRLAQAADWQ